MAHCGAPWAAAVLLQLVLFASAARSIVAQGDEQQEQQLARAAAEVPAASAPAEAGGISGVGSLPPPLIAPITSFPGLSPRGRAARLRARYRSGIKLDFASDGGAAAFLGSALLRKLSARTGVPTLTPDAVAALLDADPDLGVDLIGESLLYVCRGIVPPPGTPLPPAPAAATGATTHAHRHGRRGGAVGATVAAAAGVASGVQIPTATLVSQGQAFNLSSRPAAARKLYLNFKGTTLTGTSWNRQAGKDPVIIEPFDTDGDLTSFSSNELTSIVEIWKGVAEDYIALDLDVSTIPMASGTYGTMLVIGGDSSWLYPSGGVAKLGSHGTAPAPLREPDGFVFPKELGAGYPKYVWEATSHEAGHTLGLQHDGNATYTYWPGIDGGDWAPIMGNSYAKKVTTFDNGQYPGAVSEGQSTVQADWAVMTSASRFPQLFTPATGASMAAAVPLTSGVANSGFVTRPGFDSFFRIDAAAGALAVTVGVADAYGNVNRADLNAKLTVYNAAGAAVGTADPLGVGITNGLGISAAAFTLQAGTYFLGVSGAASGTYANGGFGNYSSRGAFSIAATFTPAACAACSGGQVCNQGGGCVCPKPYTLNAGVCGCATGTKLCDTSCISSTSCCNCNTAVYTCSSSGTCGCSGTQKQCPNGACYSSSSCCVGSDCTAPNTICLDTTTAGQRSCFCNAPPNYNTCTYNGVNFCVSGLNKCCVTSNCGSTSDKQCVFSGDIIAAGGGTCTCTGTSAGKKYCATTKTCVSSTTCCNSECAASASGSSCVSGACACPAGQKACSATKSCIPTASCCLNGDCAVSGQVCASGACACPAGTKLCAATNSCIPTASCCLNAECLAVSGQVCASGACACPAGTKLCAATNSCIPTASCCVNADCSAVSGQVCASGACACPAGTKLCAASNSCIPTASCCVNGDCSSVPGQTCNLTSSACECPAGLRACPASPPQFPSASCSNASLPCPASVEVVVKAAAADWTMVRVNTSTSANVTLNVTTTDGNGTNITEPVTSLVVTNFAACRGTLTLRYKSSSTVVANAKVLLKWTVFKATGNTAAAAANVTTNAMGKAVTTSSRVVFSNSRGCKLELLNVFPPAASPQLWFNKSSMPVKVKNLRWTG